MFLLLLLIVKVVLESLWQAFTLGDTPNLTLSTLFVKTQHSVLQIQDLHTQHNSLMFQVC